jgi:hypothetical protein
MAEILLALVADALAAALVALTVAAARRMLQALV